MPSRANAADLDLSIATDYSTGDYGGKGNIDIVYTPVVARLDLDAWSFKLVVPYLHISGGTATVTLPGGGVVETQNGTSEGLGDVVVEASYWIAPPFRYAPYVQLATRVKVPTADDDEGLGTGNPDVTPEIELARRYGRWTPYVSVGFRELGDSPHATYRDGFLVSAGATVELSDHFEPGVFAYWREAAVKGDPDAVEVLPTVRVNFGETWLIDFYATAGFTDSSPDAGGGLQIHYRTSI